jgi:choline/glycine/proline betaine transport protein
VYAYGENRDWLGGWTVFYWAWWIAWSPFVGLFIARIPVAAPSANSSSACC